MHSVGKGLRTGELEKGLYDRLECVECNETLATREDPDVLGDVRACPACGREWQAIS